MIQTITLKMRNISLKKGINRCNKSSKSSKKHGGALKAVDSIMDMDPVDNLDRLRSSLKELSISNGPKSGSGSNQRFRSQKKYISF